MRRNVLRQCLQLCLSAILLFSTLTPGTSTAADSALPVLHWGFKGQIGSSYLGSNVPFHPVAPNCIAVAGGFYSSAALAADGHVWAWGSNSYGQLGNGTNVDREAPGLVLNLDNVVAIASGNYHVLAVKNDGTVWAWGFNQAGQLGDGSRTHRNLPVQVTGLSNVVAVAAGSHHSLAVTSGGQVYSWGSDSRGQLGVGGAPGGMQLLPALVSGVSGVTSIDAFAFMSIALRSDGTVWTWGDNERGQLGDGTIVGKFSPIFNGVTNAIGVAAGGNASAALLADGTVATWGLNAHGILGDGTWVNRNTPAVIPNLSNVRKVDVGFVHMVAMKDDGTVWVWGGNADWGQLGLGLPIGYATNVPVRVTTVTGVKGIGAGGSSTLALGYLVGEEDTEPPVIACAAPPAGWQPGNVSITCTSEDSRSGLANASDASFVLSTSVAEGSEEAAASTGSHEVCDTAGNCATAGPISGIMIDRKGPDIQLTSPAGAYTINQALTALYSCTDGGSGVSTCTASVSSGSAVPSSTAGSFSFTVTASDASGNSTSVTSNYSLSYAICLMYDSTKAARSGSTIPIKLRLCDGAGTNYSSADLTVHATAVVQISSDASFDVIDAGSANPDNDFRFSDGTYIFNLKTTGLTTGSYQLRFVAGADPVSHAAPFQVR